MATARVLFPALFKSSLTASYFCLIVSNLLSLYVQLPQTKSSLSRPQILRHFAVGRQKQTVSRNAAADGTVLGRFCRVLAPKLRNDTHWTDYWRIYHCNLSTFLVSVLGISFSHFSVPSTSSQTEMDRLLQGVNKTSAEKAILKERVWSAGLKQGKCALPGGHSG